MNPYTEKQITIITRTSGKNITGYRMTTPRGRELLTVITNTNYRSYETLSNWAYDMFRGIEWKQKKDYGGWVKVGKTCMHWATDGLKWVVVTHQKQTPDSLRELLRTMEEKPLGQFESC
jgi:hypothetical protein